MTRGAVSQLSEAVAFPVLVGSVLPLHCMVISAGQEIDGATLSSTTMVCAHVFELPQASVATQVRVIVSSWGHAPPTVTSLKVIAGSGSQSVAVAEPVAGGNVLSVHWIVRSAGHVIAGGVLSLTNIVCTQELKLPQSSVAVQVRVMVPSCGQAPTRNESEKLMVDTGSQLSVAVAVPVMTGNVLEVHSIVTLVGHVITGGRLSSTCMI